MPPLWQKTSSLTQSQETHSARPRVLTKSGLLPQLRTSRRRLRTIPHPRRHKVTPPLQPCNAARIPRCAGQEGTPGSLSAGLPVFQYLRRTIELTLQRPGGGPDADFAAFLSRMIAALMVRRELLHHSLIRAYRLTEDEVTHIAAVPY